MMHNIMATVFYQTLPRELLHIILEYDGTIKLRNGVYMNRIANNDARYSIFQTIKPKEIIKIETIEYKHYYIKININSNFHIMFVYSKYFNDNPTPEFGYFCYSFKSNDKFTYKILDLDWRIF